MKGESSVLSLQTNLSVPGPSATFGSQLVLGPEEDDLWGGYEWPMGMNVEKMNLCGRGMTGKMQEGEMDTLFLLLQALRCKDPSGNPLLVEQEIG